MSVFRLAELERHDGRRLEATVLIGRRIERLWLESEAGALQETGDPFLPILLPAAMAAGFDLCLDVPVSAEGLEGSRRVGRVLKSWHPHWREPTLSAPRMAAVPTIASPSTAQAAFFSGGIDSFRTLQEHQQALSHLLFVHGFDIPVQDSRKAERVRGSLHQVAEATGLQLLTVRTNLRQFTDRWVSWPFDQCGSALASVALFLAPHFRHILIPSSYPLPFLHPYGSHPGLERNWSTTQLTLEHDTIQEGRMEKLLALADWTLARQHLRVCWQPDNPDVNCGCCRKCLATQVLLRIISKTQRWPTFPPELNLAAVARVDIDSADIHHRYLSVRDQLRRSGTDPALLEAIETLLHRHEQRQPNGAVRRHWVRLRSRLKG